MQPRRRRTAASGPRSRTSGTRTTVQCLPTGAPRGTPIAAPAGATEPARVATSSAHRHCHPPRCDASLPQQLHVAPTASRCRSRPPSSHRLSSSQRHTSCIRLYFRLWCHLTQDEGRNLHVQFLLDGWAIPRQKHDHDRHPAMTIMVGVSGGHKRK
jgi:hypothetical protein